ncbi:MAG TPA: hypothetical protein VFT82_02730 [Candidatus Paceibacterota bacterium]|nr:hypothetical protein [Candidatus Paceibacterota bacterium]
MKIELPFSEVRPGETFETSRSKRFVTCIKTQPIEVANRLSAGREVPFRNSVITKVHDSRKEDVGLHLFHDDDIVVVVDRPPGSGC